MALTANTIVESRGERGVIPFAVGSAKHIYRGAIVSIELATGYVRPSTSGVVPDRHAGVAREEADNSAGAGGDKSVEIYTEGEFLLTGSGFAQADVGESVYTTDDGTITKTPTQNVLLGRITNFVSATRVWVSLLPFPVAS